MRKIFYGTLYKYLFPKAICGRTKHSDHMDPWRMHSEQVQILRKEQE